MAQIRILAVNVGPRLRSLLHRSFQPPGYFIEEVQGDCLALERALSGSYDLIVIDMARSFDGGGLIMSLRENVDLLACAEIIGIVPSSLAIKVEPGCCYIPNTVSAGLMRAVGEFRVWLGRTQKKMRIYKRIPGSVPRVCDGPHGMLQLVWPDGHDLQETENPAAKAAASPAAAWFRTGRNHRILLAHEGDHREASALSLVLESHGFSVVVARTGPDAVTCAQHEAFHVIIVDQSVEERILHALQLMETSAFQIPVVELTRREPRMICVPPTLYIPKPCTTTDLLHQLDVLIFCCRQPNAPVRKVHFGANLADSTPLVQQSRSAAHELPLSVPG